MHCLERSRCSTKFSSSPKSLSPRIKFQTHTFGSDLHPKDPHHHPNSPPQSTTIPSSDFLITVNDIAAIKPSSPLEWLLVPPACHLLSEQCTHRAHAWCGTERMRGVVLAAPAPFPFKHRAVNCYPGSTPESVAARVAARAIVARPGLLLYVQS